MFAGWLAEALGYAAAAESKFKDNHILG